MYRRSPTYNMMQRTFFMCSHGYIYFDKFE
jgi:hypothetical protein